MPDPPQGPTQRAAAAPTARATVAGPLPVFQATEAMHPGQALAPLAEFEVGTVLNGRYRIDALLGAGGMGVVYRAQDLELKRPVAVKFLSLRLMNDEQRALLINEVNFGLDVTHPNVCRIHSFERTEIPAGPGVAAGTRIDFLCMEFVEGENLDALLRRVGKLPREQALQISQDLCAGLAAVHDKGMLHRDLKPSNIMIDKQGTARLTDFGVAALAKDAGRDGLVGTPGYLSPEALAGKPGDIRSDIYALGLVLAEIFTGKPVFKANDVATQRHEFSTVDLPRTGTLTEIEPPIRRVFLRCLDANPARRPRAVRDVAAALSEASIRRLLRKRALILGSALTLVILAADAIGLFAPAERGVYDFRVRHQFFAPPPSTQIVHVDIDDASVEEIGHWPWPRPKLAQIIREINHASPKVVAMDVVFPEPEHQSPVKPLGGDWKVVDGDKIFGTALKDGGDVLVPMMIPTQADAVTPLHSKLVELLGRDLEQTPEQLLIHLKDIGLDNPDLAGDMAHDYPFALRQAMAGRIDEALGSNPTTHGLDIQTVRAQILPQSFATGQKTAADVALEQVLPQVLSARELEKFTLPYLSREPERGLILNDVPVPELAEAARYCGFVNNFPSADGVVRQVPMLIRYRDGFMPQLGLALACAEMGCDIHSLHLHGNHLLIPRPGLKDLSIPLHPGKYDAHGDVAMFMDVPWFGGSDWKTMYDYPAHQFSAQHLPITQVWDLCQVNQEIESNDYAAEADIENVLNKIDKDSHDAFRQKELSGKIPPYDDPAAWSALMDNVFSQMPPGSRDFYLDPKSQFDNDNERQTATAVINLQRRRQLNQRLADEQASFRGELGRQIRGKAVLIGAVASSMYDFCRTPLYLQCPGVVVHGAIFSAITTGNFWTEAPRWVNLFLVVLLGLLATAAVTWLSPRRAIVTAACLFIGCLFINGIFLFDTEHWIVEATGPLVALAVVWAVCSVTRLVTMLTRARFAARWLRK